MKETLECAWNGCVPCCYKLVVTSRNREKEIPNQRAEACLRERCFARAKSTTCGKGGIYASVCSSGGSILTVGDGDFSYSLALARYIKAIGNRKSQLWVTSYETRETMLRVYPGVNKTMEELKELGAIVLYNVDATDLARTIQDALSKENSIVKLPRFERIIWNFPCLPVTGRPDNNAGLDGQVEELDANKILLKKFSSSASSLLIEKKNGDPMEGEVHVTHKTKEPFSWWDIPEQICSTGELNLVQRIIFDRASYPPYRNRKALDKKSFPCHDAEVFVFRKSQRDKCSSSARSEKEENKVDTENEIIYKGKGALSDYTWKEVSQLCVPEGETLVSVTHDLLVATRFELQKLKILSKVKGKKTKQKKKKKRRKSGQLVDLMPKTGKRPRREWSGGERKRRRK
eukprot:g4968.t1